MVENLDWGSPGRVTLNDVAKQAEVSRALVSIVMRGAPGASETTRERVMAAASALGYRPDVRARALAGSRSRLLGVLFGVGVGVFQFDLLEGLYAAAEAHGHHLVLSPLTQNRSERRAVQSLHDFRIDALIMLGPPEPIPLLAGKVPIVAVGWQVDHPAVDVVRTSDEHGMDLVVGHLAGLGHRRIVHIDGGATSISAARRRGYVQAMHARGLDAYIRILAGGQAQLDGQRAAHVLLNEGNFPSAIVAYNDDVAAAASALLAQYGLDVPRDVSITGWDASQAAALSPTDLTSVVQDAAAMARLAVERAVARVNDSRVDNREVVLQPELRLGASTDRNLDPSGIDRQGRAEHDPVRC